jgi:hypothetical protein
MAPANVPWRGPVMASVARQMLQPTELPAMRERACAALVASHDPGVGLLLKRAIAAPEEQLRRLAALGLGALREVAPAESVALLGARLSDESPVVRLAAAHALAAIGSNDAVDALVHALLEGDDDLRRAAAEGLGANPGEGQRSSRKASPTATISSAGPPPTGCSARPPSRVGHPAAAGRRARDTGGSCVGRDRSLQRRPALHAAPVRHAARRSLAWLIQWPRRARVGTGAAALKALGAALIDDEPAAPPR